ncbi:hypothetical protein SPI_01541 [Niveomyces insectorum RCEF 264]|uniref:Uncharacterized protein n=1 Tax=Niveomyces insectorum RCEF 264 TaxID=1081102 RepID=A0A167Z1J8_9HYPO|nr:hypothetical protein SPI_01541 [Niveomyces insectorum RCEF 264]
MGPMLSAIRTLLVPAFIALLVYLFLTFAVVPVWQRYRNRYSQYLPMDTLSTQTSSLRYRMQGAVGRFFAARTWRQRTAENGGDTGIGGRGGGGSRSSSSSGLRGRLGGIFGRRAPVDHMLSDEEQEDDDDSNDGRRHAMRGRGALGGEEEGEELGEIRRDGSRQQREQAGGGVYGTRRLSRDLEQGFMDDSDEDETVR